ncbi:MAG: hypothetical protein LBG62_05720 [Candidatus Methanoplasma sp.]|jgi:hypothetical protein|nr:hypothetical protein [Candidatus Methanoplasma sp.]
MNKIKTIAAVAVAIVFIAAIGVAVANNPSREKGLYALDAQVLIVDMGGITATPKMVDSIESLYSQVYGDLEAEGYTIEDAKADSEFWSEYCDYASIVEARGNGYAVDIVLKSGPRKVAIPSAADAMLSMGTMYLTTMYYFVCMKHGAEPYSDEAMGDEALRSEYASLVAGGTRREYIESNTELGGYIGSGYLDSGKSSIAEYEREMLAEHVAKLSAEGRKTLLLATGKSVDDAAYKAIRDEVVGQGGMEALFVTASDIKGAFAGIECLGYIFGYGEYVDELIEGLQVRLYEVYRALHGQEEEHKVYWEASSGKSVSASGMSSSVMGFMGWDTSLMTGTEYDTEALLEAEPDIIVFYSNDKRDMDAKMRV